MFCLSSGSQESEVRLSVGWFFLEPLRENAFHASSLPAPGGGLQSLPCRGITQSPCLSPCGLLSVYVSNPPPPFSYEDTVTGFRTRAYVLWATSSRLPWSVELTEENIKSAPRRPAKACWRPPFQSWPRLRVRRHLQQLCFNSVWSLFSKLNGRVGDQRK